MKVYVGNLSYDANEDALREAFGAFGEIRSISIITDRETGRPRGFAFVEMGTSDEATKAIEALDGKEIAGRPIKANKARPRENRGGGGGGRGGYGR